MRSPGWGQRSVTGRSFPATQRNSNALASDALFAHLGNDIGDSVSWRLGISWLDQRATDRAYADVDEANCAIGVALALGGLRPGTAQLLTWIQNELFDVGADLCSPFAADAARPGLRVSEDYVAALEKACDEHNAGLATLRSFVLPGGTAGAALLHAARTVVRRAERSAWAAMQAHGNTVNPVAARYLNRLSDLLFILAREANSAAGDVLWRPGGER